jgi:hypothetical protein
MAQFCPDGMVVNQQKIGEVLEKWGGFMAVALFPVSVSISQAGLFLAITGWLARRRPALKSFIRLPAPLLIAFSIYALLFFFLLLAALRSDNPQASFSRGFKSELKDVFLIFGAVWAFDLARSMSGRRQLLRWLSIALGITVLSGLISIFSRYRLSKIGYHLVHGWDGSELARFQHHAGTLFQKGDLSLHIYMPIGFMNTHLTYAGILCMLLLPQILRLTHYYLVLPGLQRRLIWPAILVAGGIVILLLNNGRSALLGLGLTMLMPAVIFFRHSWKKRLLKLILPLLIAGFSILLLVNFSGKVHERFEKLVVSLTGTAKHTDYQRLFVWQASLDIFSRHVLTGTGPGGFDKEVNATIIRFSQAQPRLWYAYQVIQRGHAHNDLLHLLAIGGILTGLAYLAFFGSLIYYFLLPSAGRKMEFWKYSPLVLLGAGLLQCYFQDDEILLPFWILTGLALAGLNSARSDAESAELSSVKNQFSGSQPGRE